MIPLKLSITLSFLITSILSNLYATSTFTTNWSKKKLIIVMENLFKSKVKIIIKFCYRLNNY